MKKTGRKTSAVRRKALFRRRAMIWKPLFLWTTVILAAGLLSGCRGNGSAVVIEGGDIAQNGTEAAGETGFPASDASGMTAQGGIQEEITVPVTTQESRICVHVCGQVRSPGVYELAQGSRVWDAVEAAGGLTEEAAPDAVNLAVPVADGSKITIPSQEEVRQAQQRGDAEQGSAEYGAGGQGWYEEPGGEGQPGSEGGTGSQGTGSALVDINRADADQLMKIPGIGQVRAEAIIAYREACGRFETVEDIMKVTGIKDGLFAKIRDYITVGG